MSKCEGCVHFFAIPEGSEDVESKKGDCVAEKKDEKGKFWLAKEVSGDTASCSDFQKQ